MGLLTIPVVLHSTLDHEEAAPVKDMPFRPGVALILNMWQKCMLFEMLSESNCPW